MSQTTGVVVPYSGGIDSTYLVGMALRLGFKVHPVIKVDPDSNYVPAAVQTLELLGLKTTDYSISEQVNNRDRIADGKKGFIPGVNITEALNACAKAHYLGYNRVWMGFAASNLGLYPDQTPDVFQKVEDLYNSTYKPDRYIGISLPMLNMTRKDVVEACYILNKEHIIPLHKTLSCMKFRFGMNCGDCQRCDERQKAFFDLGIKDDTEYFYGNPYQPRQRQFGPCT